MPLTLSNNTENKQSDHSEMQNTLTPIMLKLNWLYDALWLLVGVKHSETKHCQTKFHHWYNMHNIIWDLRFSRPWILSLGLWNVIRLQSHIPEDHNFNAQHYIILLIKLWVVAIYILRVCNIRIGSCSRPVTKAQNS
jgi:hypothetical protein